MFVVRHKIYYVHETVYKHHIHCIRLTVAGENFDESRVIFAVCVKLMSCLCQNRWHKGPHHLVPQQWILFDDTKAPTVHYTIHYIYGYNRIRICICIRPIVFLVYSVDILYIVSYTVRPKINELTQI